MCVCQFNSSVCTHTHEQQRLVVHSLLSVLLVTSIYKPNSKAIADGSGNAKYEDNSRLNVRKSEVDEKINISTFEVKAKQKFNAKYQANAKHKCNEIQS